MTFETLRRLPRFVIQKVRHGMLHHRLQRLRKLARQKPLILQVETINICNAACVFCGYTSMKRRKGVMDVETFAKVIKEYANMGGGAVSLTPVVGDALLDPHLMDRFKILDQYPEIHQITLTTNAICLDKYTDEQVADILERLQILQISIGGLDRDLYKTMYAVDRFDKVKAAIERLISINTSLGNPCRIQLGFRTNDPDFMDKNKETLESYFRRGVGSSHIAVFANYSGLVANNEKLKLKVKEDSPPKSHPCAIASVHIAVLWDGRISGCGCADVQGDGLILGSSQNNTLAEIWSGKKRSAFMNSFELGKPPGLCQRCTFYQPDAEVFAREFCNKIHPKQPLPLSFFTEFWGG